MSSPYAQKGSSRGSVYAQKGSRGGSVYAGRGGSTGAKKKKHGGLLHSVAKYTGADLAANLAKDVGHTAVGIGPGLYHAGRALGTDFANEVRHPGQAGQYTPFGGGRKSAFHKEVVLPTVQQYKQTYGPLAHGDIGKFATGVYKHPLGPLLDAATVLDLGATAGVKLGALSGERAALVTRSPRAIATGKGPRHVDVSSTKPTVRGREVTLQRLRSHPKVVERRGGEVARYGKQIQAQATHHALGNLTAYTPYFKATKGLSANEWSALHIRARDAHPEDLAALWGDSPAGRIAANPKVQKLALHPTKKLLRAEQEARRLSETAGEFSVRHGMLSEESLTSRPELLQRLAAGERYVAPTPGKLGVPSQSLLKARARVTRLDALHQRAVARAAEKAVPYGKVHTRTGFVRQDLKTAPEAALKRQHIEVEPGPKTPGAPSDLPARGVTTSPTVQRLGAALSVARDELASAEASAAARVKPTGMVAGQADPMQLRSIHGKPYYVPDTMEPAKAGTPLGATGGGKAAPKALGTSKQNTGALALSGKLHLRGDVLGPEFLRRVKKVKYDEIHNALRRGAVRITPDELRTHYDGKLPKGWEFLRVKAHQGVGPVEEPSPAIRPTMRAEAEQHVPISKLIPDPEDLHGSQLAEGFSTTDPQAAHVTNGRYYIVPTRMVKAATGEFTRSSDFTRTFVRQPLKVWRSLVLGLRVGFLTNNLVGNSVMYAVKTGGQGALRDLFMAIRESHGDGVAKQVLDNAATPPPLRQSLYQEFFPEQMHGTFGRTQSPAASRLTEAAGGVGRGFNAVTGAIPRLTSSVAETGYRKALIRHYIRHSPEFKTVYRQLPKQTRGFEEAARKVLAGDGGKAYQRNISKQVNNALGDYLNLSATERNVLRNLVPFYSWYRAITVTTAHLAVDTPLRANILGQLGQIGRQWSDDKLGDVPSFLEGAIPLGNGAQGTQRVLATQGLNPYATLEQLRRGSAEDVTSLGLNPFLTAAADAYAKKKYDGGIGPAQLAGSTLQAMLLGLPPSRLIAPPGGSNLYPTRNRRTQELGYLGIPVKEYSRAEAARQKAQGR